MAMMMMMIIINEGVHSQDDCLPGLRQFHASRVIGVELVVGGQPFRFRRRRERIVPRRAYRSVRFDAWLSKGR